jgi:hypothetical protein
MLLVLFIILLGVWLLGWTAFHVTAGLFHLLLVAAVVFLVLHLFRRRTV